MEADFLAFLDAERLPRPLTNVARTIHGRWIEADAVYPEQRLIVELDGGSHRTERRFHTDRSRDRANLVDGWRTIRITPRHLYRERRELVADLRALLPQSPPRALRP
jgi:very-short-patch-repair endonuclease